MKYSHLALFTTAVLFAVVNTGSAQQAPSPTPHVPSLAEQKFFTTISAMPQGMTKTVGASSGGKFSEAATDGGVLVGFDVWMGDYGGHPIIGGLRPIFETAKGRVRGKTYGSVRGDATTIEAKPGFAVAGIEARGGDRLDGFEVQFWSIHYSGASLDAEGAYKTQLVGGEGGGKRRFPLTANGKPIVGVFGGCGNDIDRLGLIFSNDR